MMKNLQNVITEKKDEFTEGYFGVMQENSSTLM
jgi:hypothetical protein